MFNALLPKQRLCNCQFGVQKIVKMLSSISVKPTTEYATEAPSPIYINTDSEYGIGKRYAVEKLCQLLNLRRHTAEQIARDYKVLQTVTGYTMTEKYYICQEEGITDETILKYPYILGQRDLQEKLNLLKEMSFELNDTVPLVLLKFLLFERVCGQQFSESLDIEGGRLQFLSNMFEMSVQDFCAVVAKREFLLLLPLVYIIDVHTLLTDFGLTNEEIRRDFWVFKYNREVIQSRLIHAKELNLQIKTWMVRANPLIFDNYVQRRQDNLMILGDHSVAEYLAERLECTPAEARSILSKHPPLIKKSMKKTKEIIDFLFSKGFKPFHIARHPKILLHRLETTKNRLKFLEANGVHLDSLYNLTKSQKQFKSAYDTLMKNNKVKEEA